MEQTGVLKRPKAVKARQPGSSKNYLKTTLERSWLIVLLLVVWWITSSSSTNIFFPPLQSILETLYRDLTNGVLIVGAAFSLKNLFVGLFSAIIIGVVAGLAIGEINVLRAVLQPFIDLARSIPQAALVPLIIGAFGLGAGPKIYTIAFACVFPILLNTIDGVRGVEPTIRRFASVYRIPRLKYYWKVILPGAMPQIFAGIRVALPIGITVMVVSELFAAKQGIGFYILNSSSTFHMTQTWAGAILVGVIGYGLAVLFSKLERIPLKWYFKSGALSQ